MRGAIAMSRNGRASVHASLGHVLLPEQDAVLIHDMEYTQEPKSEEQKAEMRHSIPH